MLEYDGEASKTFAWVLSSIQVIHQMQFPIGKPSKHVAVKYWYIPTYMTRYINITTYIKLICLLHSKGKRRTELICHNFIGLACCQYHESLKVTDTHTQLLAANFLIFSYWFFPLHMSLMDLSLLQNFQHKLHTVWNQTNRQDLTRYSSDADTPSNLMGQSLQGATSMTGLYWYCL